MTQRPDGVPASTRTTRSSTRSRRSRTKRSARGVSMAGLAIAWLLGVPEVTAVVVGPTRAEQLEPVREALSLELLAAEHAHLRGLFP